VSFDVVNTLEISNLCTIETHKTFINELASI